MPSTQRATRAWADRSLLAGSYHFGRPSVHIVSLLGGCPLSKSVGKPKGQTHDEGWLILTHTHTGIWTCGVPCGVLAPKPCFSALFQGLRILWVVRAVFLFCFFPVSFFFGVAVWSFLGGDSCVVLFLFYVRAPCSSEAVCR